MKIRIKYSQKYCGKTIIDSYTKYVKNHAEAQQAISNLYDDPHVFHADYDVIYDEVSE